MLRYKIGSDFKLTQEQIETAVESILERLETCENERTEERIAEYELCHLFDSESVNF